GQGGDRAHRSAERGERTDPVQRPRAAGHVPLHVLHPARRLDRDAAGVERDRLADEPEQQVLARVGRLVAEDDQARLVAAAAAHSGGGTGNDSSSSQTSVPPTRDSAWAVAAPAVRSASASTSSRLPTPAATRRGASSSPSRKRTTVSPRSPRRSPVSPSRASRPPSFSSTIFAPSPVTGCATGSAIASAPA